MNDSQKPPKPVLYGGVLVFILASVGALVWFIVTLHALVIQLINMSNSIELNKGGLYMLGVSVGLGFLSFYMVVELWKGEAPSDRFIKIIGRLILLGVALMIILPHVIHYPLEFYLQNRNYFVCEKASHRWLHARTIVYMNDQSMCEHYK